MERVKVLIVDDSQTMRAVVKAVLRADPQIDVVGEAADPYEARDAIKALNPDVLTLDIEMPRMSGLEFLEKIMKLRPMPVVMVSSLTQKGAKDSIEALSMGAFECVGKPTGGDTVKALSHLPGIVRAAAKYRPQGMTDHTPTVDPSLASFKPNKKIIAIGSSTGGVEALLKLLSGFPENCPPTIITQHMPPAFLKSFAERLNNTVAPKVATATEGAPLRVGQIYIAPGGAYHMQITGRVSPVCKLIEGDPVSGHRPSVDVMFKSVETILGGRAIAMLLTGMGRDGAKGLLGIRNAKGYTIAQDEASSTVYGMARVAKELGGVDIELPLTKITAKVMSLCDINTTSKMRHSA